MPVRLGEKVAVITGASSGIGKATALELARREVRGLALVDLDPGVQKVAQEINESVGRSVARAYEGDTTDEGFRRRVFQAVRAEQGIAEVLVPAAGITRDALSVRVDRETGEVSIYPVETFRLVTEVNLIAPIYWALEMVALCAADRRERGLGRWDPSEGSQGSVIFIGSVSSQGNKGQLSYATTKAGLEGAAATVNVEAMFHGIRCSVIHPGFTDTPMVRALGDDYIKKHILPFTTLRRLIQPEEIADAICFLIQNAAVSGELWADAGWQPSP